MSTAHDVPGVFARRYRARPEVTASAPGRVNLIGDHTDYNDGLVMPTAIPQTTVVELSVGADVHEVFSEDLGEFTAFAPGAALPAGFGRYVGGCIKVLESEGVSVPPLRIAIHSRVPLGAGLSSSAALEVATLRAIDARLALGIEPVRLAELAQRVELDHVGVQCGIMDQMASSLATESRMLFLDTRTMRWELLPLPEGAEVLVVHSGVSRRLDQSAYNTRRRECRDAAAALGVHSLRDITSVASLDVLPDRLRRRARHVITENARVEAARTASAGPFGRAMTESHASLRDDYEVSVAAVDRLVAELNDAPEVFGARMTGAGFGGACVALVAAGTAHRVGRRIVAADAAGARRIIVPDDARSVPSLGGADILRRDA